MPRTTAKTKTFKDMKILKYILSAALLSAGAASAQTDSQFVEITGKSIFTQNNSWKLFAGVEDALNAYVGTWAGLQNIYIEGKEIVQAGIQQSYIPDPNSMVPRLIGTGKIISGAATIPTRSFISVDGDRLLLEIVDENGGVSPYSGFVENGAVIWVPRYFVLTYDYQADSFMRNDRGIVMVSSGRRYVEMPGGDFKGYMEMRGELTKDDNRMDMKKINSTRSTQFSLPKSSLQD